MKAFTHFASKSVLLACVLGSSLLLADQAKNLDELLFEVKTGGVKETRENQIRERKFKANKNQQEKMLADLENQIKNQESQSEALEALFEQNDTKIGEAESRLRDRMGSLGELFGHITSAAGDARGNFGTSLVSINYPGRDKFLSDLIAVTSSSSELPEIAQIERLWFELQREMTEQGKVVAFDADVSRSEGTAKEPVIRIGTFNVIAKNGEYLKYQDGRLSVLPRQPASKYTSEAKAFASLNQGFTKMGIDPTGPSGGSLLSALIDTPTIMERWHQGGIVGYVISVLGVFAVLLGLWRLFVLAGVGRKVNAQLKSKELNKNNPLGRVLFSAEENEGADTEAMELKLNEAILKELPRLTTGESLLKIIAAVAPLLGLLGTVTGMIMTFQAITIYGAGDPKAMAGGISSALITTVLGLIVAIPTILMHTFVASRSKHIIHVLEEQAAGIVAEHQEKAA